MLPRRYRYRIRRPTGKAGKPAQAHRRDAGRNGQNQRNEIRNIRFLRDPNGPSATAIAYYPSLPHGCTPLTASSESWQAQQRALDAKVASQQILLGKLLYQQYLGGKQEYLKLLLNNQDPNQAIRDLGITNTSLAAAPPGLPHCASILSHLTRPEMPCLPSARNWPRCASNKQPKSKRWRRKRAHQRMLAKSQAGCASSTARSAIFSATKAVWRNW